MLTEFVRWLHFHRACFDVILIWTNFPACPIDNALRLHAYMYTCKGFNTKISDVDLQDFVN